MFCGTNAFIQYQHNLLLLLSKKIFIQPFENSQSFSFNITVTPLPPAILTKKRTA